MDLQKLKELFFEIEGVTIDDVSHLDFDLKELLVLEKRRLGFSSDNLVFVSAGDFSKFYWCSMQTCFSLRDHEVDKFSGYLQDKIEYSIKLGRLKEVPKTKEELILIGDDILLDDIFELLEREEYSNDVSVDEVSYAQKKLEECVLPTKRGHLLETIYAKKLPQIHFFVRYDDFVFTCEPDGIGDDFVYEFKSSKNRYFSINSIMKAKLQTDIYSICFDKENKLIDQLIVDENNKIENIEEKVDINRVDFVIASLKEVIKGKLPLVPNEKFKCRVCQYKDKCKIKDF